ncbi:MAG: type III-B CRISPR module RAMP protein Cmr4 [Spirochaetales bacterium]|nr:type III-B CRISPR module RAMP protein Cmr4 [Spirochaetales bacterium]
MKFKKRFYILRTLTNMHTGSGEVSLGIVDNMVQRDTVYETPTINSSSLKGALREYCEQEQGLDDKEMTAIFGSKPNSDDNSKNEQGKYRFFNAHLMAMPVRSSTKPFYMATSLMILKHFLSQCSFFEFKGEMVDQIQNFCSRVKEPERSRPIVFEPGDGAEKDKETIALEDYEAVIFRDSDSQIKTGIDFMTDLLKSGLALFHDDDFKELCKNLPVIARNNLENGESKNLWYEEIVPHHSLFYTIILKQEGQDIFDYDFHNNLVQIGAGATIGYGYTKFERHMV